VFRDVRQRRRGENVDEDGKTKNGYIFETRLGDSPDMSSLPESWPESGDDEL